MGEVMTDDLLHLFKDMATITKVIIHHLLEANKKADELINKLEQLYGELEKDAPPTEMF